MSFNFNYHRLQQRGYKVNDDGANITVTAGSNAEPVLTRETYDAIYNDIQSTTRIAGHEAEHLVETFTNEIINKHIWLIAVSEDNS